MKTVRFYIENKIPVFESDEVIQLSLIGRGSFGECYKSQFRTGEIVCKKQLYMDNIDFKCLCHELVILLSIQEKWFPDFLGLLIEGKNLSLIFKYVEGTSLDKINLSELEDKEKYIILNELSHALNYLHSKAYIHRDVKPSNIIYDRDSSSVYLIDFGFAKICLNGESTITRARGSLIYTAPEVFTPVDDIEKEQNENQLISLITPKIDVWSFGCLVSYMYSGKNPWHIYSAEASIMVALSKKIEFAIPEEINCDQVLQIIKECTRVDSTKRPSLEIIQPYIYKLLSS